MKLVIDRPKNWPILKNNKKIYVISPAYSSSLEEILKINKFLENWGLEGIFYQPKERNNLEFLSNSDSDRLNELKNALYGDESGIIFCSAGGYGSARIVRKLLKSKEAIKNKLFLGFSDITSLHLALNNYFNIPTLHSPMLRQLAVGKIDQQAVNFLHDILTQKELCLSYSIKPLNELAQNIQNINLPKLLGGNLSLVQTSIGTDWQINNNGDYSMLIEEFDEKFYSIDKMLNHLQNANVFNNCKALFIGDFSKIEDKKKYLAEILKVFISDLNIPVFKIENIGHKKINLAIPLGLEMILQ